MTSGEIVILKLEAAQYTESSLVTMQVSHLVI